MVTASKRVDIIHRVSQGAIFCEYLDFTEVKKIIQYDTLYA